jgi:hypothetical protein
VIDPFSEEADPRHADKPGRRAVLRTLAVIPAVATAAGCIHPAPACPAQPEHQERCRHRFCRYHRG